jgi:hypothetical protein
MLGISWLPHGPSHTVDDVSTPVIDRAFMFVIPSHILESVLFTLPKSPIIWHASQELLDVIPIFEAWATLRGVCFLRHFIIVRLHAFQLHARLDLFVLFTRQTRVVGIA